MSAGIASLEAAKQRWAASVAEGTKLLDEAEELCQLIAPVHGEETPFLERLRRQRLSREYDGVARRLAVDLLRKANDLIADEDVLFAIKVNLGVHVFGLTEREAIRASLPEDISTPA